MWIVLILLLTQVDRTLMAHLCKQLESRDTEFNCISTRIYPFTIRRIIDMFNFHKSPPGKIRINPINQSQFCTKTPQTKRNNIYALLSHMRRQIQNINLGEGGSWIKPTQSK